LAAKLPSWSLGSQYSSRKAAAQPQPSCLIKAAFSAYSHSPTPMVFHNTAPLPVWFSLVTREVPSHPPLRTSLGFPTQSAPARTSAEQWPLSASDYSVTHLASWSLVCSTTRLYKSLALKGLCGGHMGGSSAGSTEEDQSKALKRHLETKSLRYLISKEAAIAGYIRRNESAFHNR
jgi:hypothetical protein